MSRFLCRHLARGPRDRGPYPFGYRP